MVYSVNGFQIKRSPTDQQLVAYPVTFIIAAGVTGAVSFPNQARGFAKSVLFINQDGVNAATIRIDGISAQAINLPASASLAINDQWISMVNIIAGAAGGVIVIAQIVPFRDVS